MGVVDVRSVVLVPRGELARRRGVNGGDLAGGVIPARLDHGAEILQGVALEELERIERLGFDVHANDLESGAVVA